MPSLNIEIDKERLKNNFIFRFYDLEIGAEDSFYNLGEFRIGGAPHNNLHTSFRPAGLEHQKQLA